MKGSLHTDELLGAAVAREAGLRTGRRVSHVFVFDVPRSTGRCCSPTAWSTSRPTLATSATSCGNAIDLRSAWASREPQRGILSRGRDGQPGDLRRRIDAPALCRWPTRGADPRRDGRGPARASTTRSRPSRRATRASNRRSPATPTCCWCPTSTPATCSTRAHLHRRRRLRRPGARHARADRADHARRFGRQPHRLGRAGGAGGAELNRLTIVVFRALVCRASKAVGGCPSALRCGGGPAGRRPLRCSRFGRVAELAAFAALSALRQLRRVSSRSALRAPTEALRSSPPQRRAAGHPPTALRDTPVLWERKARSGHRARIAPRARRRASCRVAGSMPATRLLFRKEPSVPAKTRAGGGRSASAAPSSAGLAGRARSALRGLTRRSCPSAASAANAASSATGRKTEQRRGRRPAGPRTSRSEAEHAARPRLCPTELTASQRFVRRRPPKRGGAPDMSIPIHDSAATAPPGAREVKTTTCYMCACRCGIRVHLRDGEVRYIDGNPEHPINKGVICAKGASGIMKQYSPARLTQPLRRKAGAERGAGEFEPISWDEAFAMLEERLAQHPRDRPEEVRALHRPRPDAGADRPVRAPVRHAQLRGARRLLLGQHGRRHDLHDRRLVLGVRRPRSRAREAVRDDRHRRGPSLAIRSRSRSRSSSAPAGASSRSTRCAPATRRSPTSGCRSRPAPTARCCSRSSTSSSRTGLYDRDFLARYTNAGQLVERRRRRATSFGLLVRDDASPRSQSAVPAEQAVVGPRHRTGRCQPHAPAPTRACSASSRCPTARR